MSTFILIGIDPFHQPGVDEIYKFDIKDDALKFIKDWLNAKLDQQSKTLTGLKGCKKDYIQQYINYLNEWNVIQFYGEFTHPDNANEPYEYKWELYEL